MSDDHGTHRYAMRVMSQLCDSARQCALTRDDGLDVLGRNYRAHLRLMALLFPEVGLSSAMLLDGPVLVALASEGSDPLAWARWGEGGDAFVHVSSHRESLADTLMAMVGANGPGSCLKGFRFSALSADEAVQDEIARVLRRTPTGRVRTVGDLVGLLRGSLADTGLRPDALERAESAWARLIEAQERRRLRVSPFGGRAFRDCLRYALQSEEVTKRLGLDAGRWFAALLMDHLEQTRQGDAPTHDLEERSRFRPLVNDLVDDPDDRAVIVSFYERAYLRAIALQNGANFLSLIPHGERPGGEARLFDALEGDFNDAAWRAHGGAGHVVELPEHFMEYLADDPSIRFSPAQWEARGRWFARGDLRDLETFLRPLVEESLRASVSAKAPLLELFEGSMLHVAVDYQGEQGVRRLEGAIRDLSVEHTRRILELFASVPSRRGP